jgi:hypothetical protein
VGEQVELILERTRHPGSVTTHWPTLVEPLWSELYLWLGANQGLAFHVQGYTAGMAFLLSVLTAKCRTLIRQPLSCSGPLLTSIRAQISHAFTRWKNGLALQRTRRVYCSLNLLMSSANGSQGIK